MPHRRHLIPLLAAALVIQSLVATLPHQHGSRATDARAFQAVTTVDVSHGCLACSVHAPVVEPRSEIGVAATPAVAVSSQVHRQASHVLPILASVGPRGPPQVA